MEQHLSFVSDANTARDTLTLMGLWHARSSYPAALSGGMKKRLSVARAVCVDPKVMVLDEAFSFLDDRGKWNIIRDLTGIWESQGTTVIVITHDHAEISTVAQEKVHLTWRGISEKRSVR